MKQYRSKELSIINAAQFNPPLEIPAGVINIYKMGAGNNTWYTGEVWTIQGQKVRVEAGEWIVQEKDNPERHYPIADDVFKEKYELFENQPTPSSTEASEGKLYIWNGIEGDLDEVNTIQDAKDYYKDYMEGGDLHPDIESIIILREIGHIDIQETGEMVTRDNEEVPVCKTQIIITENTTPSPSTTVKEEKNISQGLNFSEKVMKIWESTKHDAIVRTKKHVGYSSDDLSEILEIAKNLSFEPGAGTKI